MPRRQKRSDSGSSPTTPTVAPVATGLTPPSSFASDLSVELRPTTSVRPYDANPRENDQAVDAVAASIQEFGWRQPIVVDQDGVIVTHIRA